MLMDAMVHGGWADTVRDSVLELDSEIPCRTGDSNLRQKGAGYHVQPTEPQPHPQFPLDFLLNF